MKKQFERAMGPSNRWAFLGLAVGALSAPVFSQPQERAANGVSVQPTPSATPVSPAKSPIVPTPQGFEPRTGTVTNLNAGWKATPINIDPHWDPNPKRGENYVVADITVNDTDRLVRIRLIHYPLRITISRPSS